MGQRDAGSIEFGGQAGKPFALRAEERWICVQTQAHKEMLAADNLRRQDYQCFVPSVFRQVRHARRVHTMLKPFFPRYVFAVLDLVRQPWRPVLHTIGVSSVIMGSERPKVVPEGIVEALIGATDSAGSLDFRDGLRVGQKVRLLTGPFADFVGRLERLDDKGRVAVLLDVMGGERRLWAERAAMQALSS